jgi:hypothetical protein
MTSREFFPSGPAVSRTLAYNSRGAPLTQSRKCLINEGAVALLKQLTGKGRGEVVWEIARIADSLYEVASEDHWDRVCSRFISSHDAKCRARATYGPPQIYRNAMSRERVDV